MLSASTAIAEEIYPEVKVMEPYIELHTGPGAGYPIFYVVDRGEFIEVIKRKTDWFKVRDEKGKTGWVSRAQLEKTFVPGGEQIQLRRVSLDNFSGRRWEAGLLGGEFIDSPVFEFVWRICDDRKPVCRSIGITGDGNIYQQLDR